MKVFLVQRNADMTEGRGPMVNDLCFLHRIDAEKYINAKPGVMGRKLRWSDEEYGDWMIIEIEVLEHSI